MKLIQQVSKSIIQEIEDYYQIKSSSISLNRRSKRFENNLKCFEK